MGDKGGVKRKKSTEKKAPQKREAEPKKARHGSQQRRGSRGSTPTGGRRGGSVASQRSMQSEPASELYGGPYDESMIASTEDLLDPDFQAVWDRSSFQLLRKSLPTRAVSLGSSSPLS